MKPVLALLGVCLLTGLLSSCSMVPANTEDLLEPPKLRDVYKRQAIAKNAKCETINGYVVMVMGENSDAIYQSISDTLNAK